MTSLHRYPFCLAWSPWSSLLLVDADLMKRDVCRAGMDDSGEAKKEDEMTPASNQSIRLSDSVCARATNKTYT
ncbi:hypothetical protein QBC32DRAFT_346919 [Pseudoneurospora amorphoporcata]|uniref:Secreted protein n=1 Tax=Pseudoneurospora amorphoporcata TaxID=241081 RepID=A0AAN6NQM4_9PEZI|nr:hypothetical protein QBC32DRAFT_346919 [Pseudoneurospora amorphoporcata]